jgi:uncharacterized protein (DUF2345 family)
MSISTLNNSAQTGLVPNSLLGYSSNGVSAIEITPTAITIAGDLDTPTPIYVGISASTGLTTTLATGLDVNCDFNMNGNDITNLDTLSSTIGVAMNINGDDNLILTAGGDLSLTGDANVYITASNTSVEISSYDGLNISSITSGISFSTNGTEVQFSNCPISMNQNNITNVASIIQEGNDLNINNGSSALDINISAGSVLNLTAESDINLTSTTGKINANSSIKIIDATEPTWNTELSTGGLFFTIPIGVNNSNNITLDAEGGAYIGCIASNGVSSNTTSMDPFQIQFSDGTITTTLTQTSITTNDNFSISATGGDINLNSSADINITSTDNIILTSTADAISLNANLDITLTAVQGFLNITSTNDEISLTSSGATNITSNTGNIELIPINDGITESGIVRINKNNSLLGDGFLTAGTINISSDELGYNITPQLTITNLNATAGITNGVPSVSFYKNGRIAGNNDRIGDFYFNANDTTNNSREWARMEVVTRNVAVGNEDGSISFFASLNGVSTEFLRINGADGDNNFLRPLDMNGSSIVSTSGSLSISASASTGAGTITLTPKPLGNLIFANLPTSSVGLPTGAVWNNLGVLNIAP